MSGTAREHRRQGGFTLVEVLVSVTLALVVAGAIASFNRFQLFTLQNQAVQLDVQSTARSIVELMSREIRRAGLNATPAFCGVAVARYNALRIQADHDGDGSLNGPNEDVTYRYNSDRNAIERIDHVANRTDVLVDGLQTVSFRLQYFDQNGAQLAGTSDADGTSSGWLGAGDRSDVRRIRLTLVLAERAADPTNSQILRARAVTDIDLRNRFFAGGSVNSQPCT